MTDDEETLPSEKRSFSDIFTELCPMYMAYGMTYEQYWYGDPWMVRAFAQAFLLKRKIRNEDAWIQGAYIANAFSTVLSNAFGKKKANYLEKPLDLFPKTEGEKQMEIREQRRKLVAWLSKMKKVTDAKNRHGSDSDGKPGNP